VELKEDVFGPTDIATSHLSPKDVIDRLLYNNDSTPTHAAIIAGHIHQGVPTNVLESGSWKISTYFEEIRRLIAAARPGNVDKANCHIFRQDKFQLLHALSDDLPDQPLLTTGLVVPTLKLPIFNDGMLTKEWISKVASFMATHGDGHGFIIKTHNTTNSKEWNGRKFVHDPKAFLGFYRAFCRKYKMYLSYFFLQPIVDNRKVSQ
jgi:hypothetical protein